MVNRVGGRNVVCGMGYIIVNVILVGLMVPLDEHSLTHSLPPSSIPALHTMVASPSINSIPEVAETTLELLFLLSVLFVCSIVPPPLLTCRCGRMFEPFPLRFMANITWNVPSPYFSTLQAPVILPYMRRRYLKYTLMIVCIQGFGG